MGLREAIADEIDQGRVVAVEGISVGSGDRPGFGEYRSTNRNFASDRSRFTHVGPLTSPPSR